MIPAAPESHLPVAMFSRHWQSLCPQEHGSFECSTEPSQEGSLRHNQGAAGRHCDQLPSPCPSYLANGILSLQKLRKRGQEAMPTLASVPCPPHPACGVSPVERFRTPLCQAENVGQLLGVLPSLDGSGGALVGRDYKGRFRCDPPICSCTARPTGGAAPSLAGNRALRMFHSS